MGISFAVQLSVTGCGYVGEMPAEVCALKNPILMRCWPWNAHLYNAISIAVLVDER